MAAEIKIGALLKYPMRSLYDPLEVLASNESSCVAAFSEGSVGI